MQIQMDLFILHTPNKNINFDVNYTLLYRIHTNVLYIALKKLGTLKEFLIYRKLNFTICNNHIVYF